MYSIDIKQAAIELVRSGKSVADAAKIVGVSRRSVWLWYYTAHPEKKGPSKTCVHKRSPTYPPATLEAAWQLKAQGNKYEYMSVVLGVPMCTMCDWFKFRTRIKTNKVLAQKYGFEAGGAA